MGEHKAYTPAPIMNHIYPEDIYFQSRDVTQLT
jgi:hypothetical protein